MYSFINMKKGYSGMTVDVFRNRVARLLKEIQEKALDGLLLFSDEYRPGYTVYISDYKPINVIEESPEGVFISAKGEVVLFLGAINVQAAKKVSWIEDIRSVETLPEFFNVQRDRVNGRKLKIGLVGEALLPVKYYRRLQAALADNDFIYMDDILTSMRQIKNDQEILLMEKAAEIGDASIRSALERMKRGKVSEIELCATAEFTIRKRGGDIGSATVLSSGMNTEAPTWRPTHKEIDIGEAVLIDMAPSYNGYCSDVAVTVFNGKVDGEKKKPLALSKDILLETIAFMKPGEPASSIYDSFLKQTKKYGYEDYFTPYAQGLRAVGHSVGLDVVERPNLDSDATFLMEPGMTLGVKFDLHGFDFGGLRMEAVVLVERNGCRSLNKIIEEIN